MNKLTSAISIHSVFSIAVLCYSYFDAKGIETFVCGSTSNFTFSLTKNGENGKQIPYWESNNRCERIIGRSLQFILAFIFTILQITIAFCVAISYFFIGLIILVIVVNTWPVLLLLAVLKFLI